MRRAWRDADDDIPDHRNRARSARAHQTDACHLAAAALAALLAGASARAPPRAPTSSYFKLANGLEVVVIPDRRTPVVTHMLWYKVGAADEPPGKSGIAHFLEHLLFKGTVKNPAGKFSQTVAAIGGQENAFTSSDYTGYFQRTSREHLKTLMEFEADRMTGLVLTDDVVTPELNVVLEEQNQRVANNPGARLGEQIEAALYLNHPYGKPVIGWRHEIEKLNRDDALAFYKRFYTPNNAVLVVAGDVTADEVKALAEETYGKVAPATEIGPRKRPQEPAQVAPRQVTLADPRVDAAQPAALLSRALRRDRQARRVRGAGRAGAHPRQRRRPAGSTARWWSTASVAVSAGGWYSGSALDATRFGVYGSPKPGVTLQQLEAGDRRGDRRGRRQGRHRRKKLERAKNRLIADAVYAQDNQATLARWYGVALTTGSTVDRSTPGPTASAP